MKISIVTATYNSAATVRSTIESVLGQTYGDYEHIIVDGLSKDDTVAICRSYEGRYRGRLRIISERDRGIYDAMNKGVRLATGDVVGILNSDDMLSDETVLELIAKAINGTPGNEADCVYGDLVFVDAADTSRVVRTWKGSQHTKGGFLKGWHPAHPTFYARRELFSRLGGFDTTFNVSADFELMLRFIEKGEARNRYIPHTLVKMRMGGESTGSIKSIIEGNRNVLRAFEKNGLKVPPFYLVRRLAPKAWNMVLCKLGMASKG